MFDPMKIARPYARAVFQIAKEQMSLKLWESFLYYLTHIVGERSVNMLLKDPTVCVSFKISFLKSIYNIKFTNVIMDNFIGFIANKRRLLYLPSIYMLFKRSLCIEEKEVQVMITTASFDLKELKVSLDLYLHKVFGKNVNIISECVDKRIIGGVLITTISNKVIDITFYGNLKRLGQLF